MQQTIASSVSSIAVESGEEPEVSEVRPRVGDEVVVLRCGATGVVNYQMWDVDTRHNIEFYPDDRVEVLEMTDYLHKLHRVGEDTKGDLVIGPNGLGIAFDSRKGEQTTPSNLHNYAGTNERGVRMKLRVIGLAAT